ncbi:MAG: glycosyltransferase family 39 protein [Caldilineales bacterium]|nr:glycosyltransferase family 39 protein [Caldilineales bacterium]
MHRLTLFILIVLGFALRLYHLDVQSLWYDEGVTAQVARLGVGELARWTANDIQPPLYYLLVGGWLRLLDPWAGPLAFVMRGLSAVAGVLLIPIIWALARRLWDERAGLLAAALATISPLMVYYSQEARMYALLTMLVAAVALIAVRWAGEGRVRWTSVLAYIFLGLAALYTHYFAGFALAALALYWLLVWWKTTKNSRSLVLFLAANVIVVLGFLPWLPSMLNRFQVDASYWAGTLKLGEALLDVGMNFTVGATEVMAEGEAIPWLIVLGLGSLIWLIAIARSKRRDPQRPLALILLWGLLPLICVLALAYRTPKFNARYLMVSWPAWALLAGGGISALWNDTQRATRNTHTVLRILAVASLVLLVTAQLAGLQNWFGDGRFAKSAWRDALAEMYFNRQPDEAALLVSGHAYPVFDTYVPPELGVARVLLPDMDILDVNNVVNEAEAASILNRLSQDYGGVWLFLWQDEVVDPNNIVVTLLDHYAQPLPVPDFPFLGLRHYRFIPGQTFLAQ